MNYVRRLFEGVTFCAKCKKLSCIISSLIGTNQEEIELLAFGSQLFITNTLKNTHII